MIGSEEQGDLPATRQTMPAARAGGIGALHDSRRKATSAAPAARQTAQPQNMQLLAMVVVLHVQLGDAAKQLQRREKEVAILSSLLAMIVKTLRAALENNSTVVTALTAFRATIEKICTATANGEAFLIFDPFDVGAFIEEVVSSLRTKHNIAEALVTRCNQLKEQLAETKKKLWEVSKEIALVVHENEKLGSTPMIFPQGLIMWAKMWLKLEYGSDMECSNSARQTQEQKIKATPRTRCEVGGRTTIPVRPPWRPAGSCSQIKPAPVSKAPKPAAHRKVPKLPIDGRALKASTASNAALYSYRSSIGGSSARKTSRQSLDSNASTMLRRNGQAWEKTPRQNESTGSVSHSCVNCSCQVSTTKARAKTCTATAEALPRSFSYLSSDLPSAKHPVSPLIGSVKC